MGMSNAVSSHYRQEPGVTATVSMRLGERFLCRSITRKAQRLLDSLGFPCQQIETFTILEMARPRKHFASVGPKGGGSVALSPLSAFLCENLCVLCVKNTA